MLTAGILLALAPAPVLQQEQEVSASIQRDAQFAIALTRQLGFDNFSDTVLEEALTRAEGKEERSALLLARCRVTQMVAQRPIEPDEQVAAWSNAADAYVDFIANDPAPNALREAQKQLGAVAFQFGERLKALMVAGDLAPERQDELIERANAIFTEGLRAVNEVRNWYTSLDSEGQDNNRVSFFETSFYRALIYYYWGIIHPAGSIERQEYVEQSVSALEEFAVAAGELSRAGLLAFKHMGDGYVALGDLAFGLDLYDFVIAEGVPQNLDDPLPPAEVAARQEVQQDAYLAKMRALRDHGRANELPAVAATFQQWIEDQRVSLAASGYRCLLLLANLMVDEGRYGEAIAVAQRVANDNERSLLRLEADEVLGRAIAEAPPGTSIDLAVLFQAGEGAYYSKRYDAAIQNLRLLVSRLEGSAQAAEFGARAYYFLARSLLADGLDLEAAVAYESGYDQYSTDEEYAARLAEGWQRLAERFRNAAPNDDYLDDFYDRAVDAVSESSDSGATHALMLRTAQSTFNEALRLRREARAAGAEPGSPEAQDVLNAFDDAIAAFKRVEEGTPSWEKAFVQIGMCEFNKFAWDNSAAQRAIAIFEEYLNEIVPDPTRAPSTPRGRKYREESVATADFYRGYTYYVQAQAGDLGAWQRMLDAFEGFEERQPEQTDYIGTVRSSRAQAYLALDQPDDAIGQYELLVADNAEGKWLANCAYWIFVHFRDQAEALHERIQAGEADAEESAARLKQYRSQAAKYLHVVNTQGSAPKWPNLLVEARLRLQTGDLSTGADLIQDTLDRFGEADGLSGAARLYARLDLVDALLEQGDPGAAVPHVDALLAEAPKMLRVKQMAIKVKVGFPIVRDGRISEVPGEGTLEAYETAAALASELRQLAESAADEAGLSRFEYQPWWEARVQYAYLLYKWGQLDSTRAGSHLKLIDSIEKQAPQFGREFLDGPEIPMIFNWLKTQS